MKLRLSLPSLLSPSCLDSGAWKEVSRAFPAFLHLRYGSVCWWPALAVVLLAASPSLSLCRLSKLRQMGVGKDGGKGLCRKPAAMRRLPSLLLLSSLFPGYLARSSPYCSPGFILNTNQTYSLNGWHPVNPE